MHTPKFLSHLTTNLVLFDNLLTVLTRWQNIVIWAKGQILMFSFLFLLLLLFYNVNVAYVPHLLSWGLIITLNGEVSMASVLNLVLFFNPSGSVLSELDTLQFFTKDVTPAMLFPTVHDAVLSCQHSRRAAQASTSQATSCTDDTWVQDELENGLHTALFLRCYIFSQRALNIIWLDVCVTYSRWMFLLCKTLTTCAQKM